jgi:hypothetical protein
LKYALDNKQIQPIISLKWYKRNVEIYFNWTHFLGSKNNLGYLRGMNPILK